MKWIKQLNIWKKGNLINKLLNGKKKEKYQKWYLMAMIMLGERIGFFEYLLNILKVSLIVI